MYKLLEKNNNFFLKSAKHTSVTNSIRSIYSTNAPTHIHNYKIVVVPKLEVV